MAATINEMALSPRQALNSQRVQRIPGWNLNLTKTEIKVGTWNVRSMNQPGKLRNTINEMQRLNIKILGISEMRWRDSGKYQTSDATVFFSGSKTNNYYGVAIIINKELTQAVTNFIPYSDRIIMVQLKAKPFNINLIQVYAPTENKDDNEIEDFYNQIKQIQKATKNNEVNIILGDFNAKIGSGRVLDIVGEYGLGNRNERGDRLVQFCQEENMMVTNTWFKLPPRRLYTWVSPQDNPKNNKIVRNQIDFILINKRFRNCVKSAKTYPGADVGSDHNPVVVRMQLKLKIIKRTQNSDKIHIEKLKDKETRQRTEEKLNEELRTNNTIEEHTNIDKKWNTIKDIIVKVGKNELKQSKIEGKKEWMTQEILTLMEQRRKYKNRNTELYNQTHRLIKVKIKEAKEKWLQNCCEEIEELQRKHDDFNLHKKIKLMAGTQRKQLPEMLQDGNNIIITNIEDKKNTWITYIEELFADDRQIMEEDSDEEHSMEGPEIMKAEVEEAIKKVKSGKSPGPDNIYIELIKLIDDKGIDNLTKLFNQIYMSGNIPDEMLKSTFIPIPKTCNAKHCHEFRTISLMSQALKIFLRIIHGRIRKKCEEVIGATQFGFRDSLGTREPLFCLQVLLQKCRDMQQEVYIGLIDYAKAFDKVQHEKMIKILQDIGLDARDIRIIRNLYWNQKANVKVNGELTSEIDIKRGVRQGCVLSPMLFNVYSEQIFKRALQDRTQGIKVNGVVINNIRYADDTIILANNAQDLQILLDCVHRESEDMGLKININKTKFMAITNNRNVAANIMIAEERIERVNKIKYLGCWINDQWNPDQEIKTRIECARSGFVKMQKFLCNRQLNLNLRIRMVKCYVWSILLYGVEAWTLTKRTEKKLEAFEMWIYRRLLKVSWCERISNTEILQRVNRERELLRTIKKRKTAYLGHIIRNEKYQVLQLIMKGKIEGRRGRGRKRKSWLKNIREWLGITNAGAIFRAAEDREKFAVMVANL